MQARTIAAPTGVTSIMKPSERISEEDQAIGNTRSLTPRSVFKPFSWAARNLHNLTVYGLLAATGVGLTPGGMKVFNEVLQSSASVPTPSQMVEVETREIQNDGFLSNFSESKALFNAFKILNIDSKKLDLNNDGIVLDSRDELIYANKMLEDGLKTVHNSSSSAVLKDAIRFLNEYYILSVIVWGENGPTKDSVSQNEEPNCQLMSALRAQFFTKEGVQKARSEVKIASYDLDSKTPNINFEVLVNGKWIPLSYEEVKNASCPKEFTPSTSKDESLFVSLFKTAYGKASSAIVPNIYFQTSSTMIADADYIPMLTVSMSDNELKNVLSTAPEKIVTVSGQFSLSDIRNGISLRRESQKPLEVSMTKAENFDSNIASKTMNLQNTGIIRSTNDSNNHCIQLVSYSPTPKKVSVVPAEKPLPLSSFPPAGSSSANESKLPAPILDASHVRNGHIYAVESFDRESETLMISDAHGDKVQLVGMNQIREHLSGVIFNARDINDFGDRTPLVLLGLALAGATFEGSKRGVRFVVKSLSDKTSLKA